MGHRPAFSGLERQAWLRAVERLDLALLVDRDDHRVLGRVHVEADNVLDLLGELGIVGALEGANAVRLQPMRLPQALNGAQADADRFRHGAAGPMRRVARGLGAGQVQHLGNDPDRKRRAARLARLVTQQAFDALLSVSHLPAPDRRSTDARAPRHFLNRQKIGRTKHNLQFRRRSKPINLPPQRARRTCLSGRLRSATMASRRSRSLAGGSTQTV